MDKDIKNVTKNIYTYEDDISIFIYKIRILKLWILHIIGENIRKQSFSHNVRILLYDKPCPGETLHTCLLTPNREPMMDQNTDSTRVQLEEALNFIRLLIGLGVECFNLGKNSCTKSEHGCDSFEGQHDNYICKVKIFPCQQLFIFVTINHQTDPRAFLKAILNGKILDMT